MLLTTVFSSQALVVADPAFVAVTMVQGLVRGILFSPRSCENRDEIKLILLGPF